MVNLDFGRFLECGKDKHILVIGDLVLDKYIWGTVDRISPEAPVQVVNVQRENFALGGAANVAHNLRALDCEVTLLGVIGQDDSGRILYNELKQQGIRTAGVSVDKSRPTTTKTRVVGGNQQVVRVDREATENISREIEHRLLQFLKKNIKQFDVVILSDYRKGVLTDNMIRNSLALAKKHGIKSLIDPKRNDFLIYAGATVIKPNLKETETATHRKLKSELDVLTAAQEIRKRCRCEALIVTRGKDGMIVVEKNSHVSVGASAKEVFDVTGAGDTVMAFLGMLIACGYSYSDAAKIANVAAGLAVGRVGAVAVTKMEVYHHLSALDSLRKIIPAKDLALLLPSIRRNKTIVFTNGCFDILHVGHITLLKKARALGDKLIVGVNTDASIRRIKGEKRPIVSENERTHILAALESVDYIVLFDENTPLELIKTLKPDILVKGSDYKKDQVVGHRIVKSYGGRVALVDLVAGFSTTNIVESIMRNYSNVDNSKAEKKLKKARETMDRIESLQNRFEKKISEKEKK